MADIKATYEDHMGSDLRVVNAARVSFGKRSEMVECPRNGTWDLSHGDQSLIAFLARGCKSQDWDEAIEELQLCKGAEDIKDILRWVKNLPTHWTPFGHCQITMIEEVPIFVARQRFKHQIGFVYNEVSRRYVDDEPEFYRPDMLRQAAPSVKQGSLALPVEHDAILRYWMERRDRDSLRDYQYLLSEGVCAEQARMRLPQNMMTTYYVTGSLYAWANAYIQRSEGHAQAEIQGLAAQWDAILKPLFPHSWRALTS